MKLRFYGNSLRLRLGKSELQQLAEHGIVESIVRFGPTADAVLGYAIESADVSAITANYSRSAISVLVPRTLVHRWAESEQIGLEALQPVEDGVELRILIEKDFACNDTGESQADAFERGTSLKCPPVHGVPA